MKRIIGTMKRIIGKTFKSRRMKNNPSRPNDGSPKSKKEFGSLTTIFVV